MLLISLLILHHHIAMHPSLLIEQVMIYVNPSQLFQLCFKCLDLTLLIYLLGIIISCLSEYQLLKLCSLNCGVFTDLVTDLQSGAAIICLIVRGLALLQLFYLMTVIIIRVFAPNFFWLAHLYTHNTLQILL